MYVQRRRTRIELWTPAKLNLYLEVLSRRPDGYHEIETLMVPVDLFDTLCLSSRADGRIELKSAWAPGLPDDGSLGELPSAESNLVVRALKRLREQSGVSCGMNAELCKRIPAAAGLGGGSSDAAAALVGANWLWGLHWSTPRLAEVAAELGSDIPFFLYGDAAICRGRGERIEAIRMRERQSYVILRPPFGLSTGAIYERSRVARESDPAPTHEMPTGRRWPPRLFNRLQEAALEVAPWLPPIAAQFDKLAFRGHQMSGSGSAYFGICRNRKHARVAAAAIRSRCEGRVYCVNSVATGPPAYPRASQN